MEGWLLKEKAISMAEFSRLFEESAPKPEEESVGGPAPLPQEQSGASGEPTEKEAVKLSEPSMELATKLLGRVKEYVWGTADYAHDEGLGQRIFSFEEATEFLEVAVARHGDSVSYIEPNTLKKWVDESLGDTELAQAIEELIKEKEYNNCSLILRIHKEKELIIPFEKLLRQRFEQCEELLGEETGA